MKKKTLLLSFVFIQCIDNQPHELLHWKNFTQIQSSLEVAWKDDPYRAILLGNLEQDMEPYLIKKEDGSLSLTLQIAESSLPWLTVSPKEFHQNLVPPKTLIPKQNLHLGNPSLSNPAYETRATYKKSEFKDDETYKVERITKMRSFHYSQIEFFRSLNTVTDTNTPVEKILSSPVGVFLCDSFQCSSENSPDGKHWLWRLQYTKRTEYKHPIFYSKTATRLNNLTMNLSFFGTDSPKDAIKFSNEGTSLLIQIPRKPGGVFSKVPSKAILKTNLFIKSYGLRVKIEDLNYQLRFEQSKNHREIFGQYTHLPKWEIGGRFLYLVPSGIIDFFIPGDIDGYFEDAFTLLTMGSDGEGGSRFHCKIDAQGERMNLYFTNKSEILQKRFSLLGISKKTEKPNDFLPALIEAALD